MSWIAAPVVPVTYDQLQQRSLLVLIEEIENLTVSPIFIIRTPAPINQSARIFEDSIIDIEVGWNCAHGRHGALSHQQAEFFAQPIISEDWVRIKDLPVPSSQSYFTYGPLNPYALESPIQHIPANLGKR